MAQSGYFGRQVGDTGLPTDITNQVRDNREEIEEVIVKLAKPHEVVKFVGAYTKTNSLLQIAVDHGPSVFMDNVLNVDLDAQWGRKLYHRKVMEEYRMIVKLRMDTVYAQ